jgi:hypothetical protein
MLQKHTYHNRLFPGSTEISGGTVKASGEATIMGLTLAQYIERFSRWGVTADFAGRVMRELHRTHLDPHAITKSVVHTRFDAESFQNQRFAMEAAEEGMAGYKNDQADPPSHIHVLEGAIRNADTADRMKRG